MNVHGRTVRIAKDLVLAGFGGSISSFQNNKVLWEGKVYQKFIKIYQKYIKI